MMDLNQLLAQARPPKWARLGASRKLSRRVMLALGLRDWAPARSRMGVFFPARERAALTKGLRARNDLDRKLQLQYDIPDEKAARYNAKGQALLDSHVVRLRRGLVPTSGGELASKTDDEGSTPSGIAV